MKYFLIVLTLGTMIGSAVLAEESVQVSPDSEVALPLTDLEDKSDVLSRAYEQADEIVKITKRKENVAFQLNNIATYYMYVEKQLDHSQFMFDRSYELFNQTGNMYGVAMITYNRAVLLRMKKDFPRACEKAKEASPIVEKASNNKRYNKKLIGELEKRIKTFNKINCGSGT
jgi:hypothetical protein